MRSRPVHCRPKNIAERNQMGPFVGPKDNTV